MIDLKVTKDRFKNHFYYAKWLYIVTIIGAISVFSIVFSVTEPKVPKNLKVDINIIGSTLNDSVKETWREDILNTLSEDQQEVNLYALSIGTNNMGGVSVYEVLAARMAAKEDDILILPKEVYDGLATQGAFINVDDYITKYEYPEELDLESYKIKLDEDVAQGDTEPHYFGIPLDNILGLVDLGVDPREKVAVILVYTENKDNVLKTIDYIMNKTESILIEEAKQQAEGE